MNEYYSDMLFLDMKPFTLLHRLGVNGKQSGSLAAIQEIPHAVTVMYGPRGCGFHYRNTVRVRSGPVANLECAGLTDRDVIFGGERKLPPVAGNRQDKEAGNDFHFADGCFGCHQ